MVCTQMVKLCKCQHGLTSLKRMTVIFLISLILEVQPFWIMIFWRHLSNWMLFKASVWDLTKYAMYHVQQYTKVSTILKSNLRRKFLFLPKELSAIFNHLQQFTYSEWKIHQIFFILQDKVSDRRIILETVFLSWLLINVKSKWTLTGGKNRERDRAT